MALENTHYGHERIDEMLKDCHSIFFIGIGGISMSSLAQISLSLGYRVGGSDRSENVQTAQLKAKGIPVFPSHDAKTLKITMPWSTPLPLVQITPNILPQRRQANRFFPEPTILAI